MDPIQDTTHIHVPLPSSSPKPSAPKAPPTAGTAGAAQGRAEVMGQRPGRKQREAALVASVSDIGVFFLEAGLRGVLRDYRDRSDQASKQLCEAS